MTIELTTEQLQLIINSLAYREAKIWDIIGEFNKSNDRDTARYIQKTADDINDLRISITKVYEGTH